MCITPLYPLFTPYMEGIGEKWLNGGGGGGGELSGSVCVLVAVVVVVVVVVVLSGDGGYYFSFCVACLGFKRHCRRRRRAASRTGVGAECRFLLLHPHGVTV